MALINCPECNNNISDSSDQCVHCGYKIPKNIDYKIFQKNIIIIAIIFVLISIIIYCSFKVASAMDDLNEATSISTDSAEELNESISEASKIIVEGNKKKGSD